MAIVLSQQNSNTSGTNSCTVTLGSAPTNGTLLVACVFSNNVANSHTAPAGWAEIKNSVGTTSQQASMWYKVASSEGTTFKFNSTGATVMEVAVLNYTGTHTSSPLDKSAETEGSTTGVTSRSTGTTATTTVANEVCVACIYLSNTITSPSWSNSFNMQYSGTRVKVGDKIISSTGTQETTLSWTTSRKADGIIATFKETGILYVTMNNYLFIKVGNGMSTSEKIR